MPDFFGEQSVRALCTHQVHLACLDSNCCGWQLGGIPLHTVAFQMSLVWSVDV